MSEGNVEYQEYVEALRALAEAEKNLKAAQDRYTKAIQAMNRVVLTESEAQ